MDVPGEMTGIKKRQHRSEGGERYWRSAKSDSMMKSATISLHLVQFGKSEFENQTAV